MAAAPAPPASRAARVGLLYDERMCAHATPDGEDHPENPERLRAIWRKLNAEGVASRCVVLKAKEAEDKYIASVHSNNHIKLMKEISSKKYDSSRNKIARKYNSIYFNKGSSEAAVLAAGSVIEVAEKVAAGELRSAIALVRPPGHHAEHDEAMGFCLFNNVAVAANYLLNDRPDLGIKKILIVDWDVHHGNGTQKMFYNDPRVLFFSVHRFDYGSFYPAEGDASHCFIGEEAGKGYNINVPWEHGKCGDADYIAAWDHVLLPVTEAFDPDIILVSAGFDAALGDPLGGCCITPNGYALLLTKLLGFAKGRIVMALEGGYNLRSIANSVFACAKVLLGDKFTFNSPEMQPFESTWRIIQVVRNELKTYWPVLSSKLPENLSLRIKPSPSEEAGPSGALITIESSSSGEPSAPVPETRETFPPAQAREIRFKEEQDTPNNSIFSFAVFLADEEEIASHAVPSSSTSYDVRSKLESIRTLLQGDIGRLVEDASPIRQLFNEVVDHISDEVSEDLGYAAYIEGMRIPVSRALQRMADRAQRAKTQEEVDSYKHQTQEVHHKINFLENCCPDIVGAIDRLKRRRAELAKEMEQITKEIAAEEKKLQELPTMISELKQERQRLARETIRLRRRVSEVPGSAENDQRIVESADQIRRRAIVAIDAFLGL